MAKARTKNCKYWRLKADGLWSEIVRSPGHCEICGREGKPRSDGKCISGLNAHHLITKGSAPKYRHDVNNGICLCVTCHKWGTNLSCWAEYDGIDSPFFTVSAHGDFEQMTRFWLWVEHYKPETYKWYQRHKNDKKIVDIDYEAAYNRLLEMETPNW